MDKRTFVGLCAALAFAAGSPAVHALKIFDLSQSTAQAVMEAEMADSFTYAAETLLMGTDNVTEASDDSDMAMYYNIDDDVHLAAPVGIAATAGDTYVVTFTLDGMVFQDAVGALSGGTFNLATGGASGDKLVVFRLTSGAVATTAALSLAANFAISGNAGTATMTITNQTLAGLGIPGVTGTEEHKGTVIKVAPALDEDSTKMNPTADVAESFKKFVGEMSAASVGTLQVGIEAHRLASGGNAGDDVDGIDDIIVTADDVDGDPQSTVTFMGDFSFASRVYTHGDADCGVEIGATGASGGTDTALASAETDLLIRDDDDMVSDTTKTNAVAVLDTADADNALTAARHLCIMVQGEDDTSEDGMDAPRIPETGAYTAMGSYTGIADAAIGPKPQAQTLGMIGRNGTTVRLPYLTTNAKFNQRLYIVNRGSSEADYEMDFQEGDTAGALASGTLEANSRTIISVGGTSTEDPLVTIGEGGSTSGSLIIEAQPGMIDVASVQVSRELGTTDTVVYDF